MSRMLRVIVGKGGVSRHLVSDRHTEEFEAFGQAIETYRNSHVETWSSLSLDAQVWLLLHGNAWQKTVAEQIGLYPDEETNYYRTRWWADMLPTCGCVLGPFDSHADALKAEQDLLHEHNLPARID